MVATFLPAMIFESIKTLSGEYTQDQIAKAMKATYSDEELKQMADEAGVSSVFTPGSWDIDRFVNSEAGKKAFIKHLTDVVDQYHAAGYTDKEILKLMQ